MDPAAILFSEASPSILNQIRPHQKEAVLRILREHLKNVPDLSIFNARRENVPAFIRDFVDKIRKNIPSPGDAFGIHLTCRITKDDTQDTLDSKHLRDDGDSASSYRVEPLLAYELNLFTTQTQVLEMANRRKYSSVYVRDYTVQQVMSLFPYEMGHLVQEEAFNKGRDVNGVYRYLNTFRFIVTEARLAGYLRITYTQFKDLDHLLRRLKAGRVVAFTDAKLIFQKCGIVSYFFNYMWLVRFQLYGSMTVNRDIANICKYQCRSGKPLPMNRDGLAKNPYRSPLEVLSFEAPKKNFVRFCTQENQEGSFPVRNSMDKIFFGQQFNEGTGYSFELRNDGWK